VQRFGEGITFKDYLASLFEAMEAKFEKLRGLDYGHLIEKLQVDDFVERNYVTDNPKEIGDNSNDKEVQVKPFFKTTES